jgi:hypothetical protein
MQTFRRRRARRKAVRLARALATLAPARPAPKQQVVRVSL